MNAFEEISKIMNQIHIEPAVVAGVITIILTFIIEFVLVHKGYLNFNGNKKKVQKAEKLNHVIKATRISKWDDDYTGTQVDAWYHAKYEYVVNDKKRIYRYLSRKNPPLFLNLYYINNPYRVFHDEDKKSSLWDILIIIIPFALGILVMKLMGFK